MNSSTVNDATLTTLVSLLCYSINKLIRIALSFGPIDIGANVIQRHYLYVF